MYVKHSSHNRGQPRYRLRNDPASGKEGRSGHSVCTQHQKGLRPCRFKQKNKSITVINLDVTRENGMKQIATEIKCKIDILICNASVLNGYGGLEYEAHHSQAIEAVLMTNIAGVFFTARSFLPHLAEKNSKSEGRSDNYGKIVVISSIMGSQKHAGSNAPIY